MLIPASVFAMEKIADVEFSRYALGGVRFERDPSGQAVAIVTDGQAMLAIQWPEDPAEEYPGDSVGLSTEHVDGFGVVVPVMACRKAAKLPPKKTPKPILRNVLLEEPGSNGIIPMGATDCAEAQQVRPHSMEGKFPRWREHYPRPGVPQDDSVSVTLRARLLIDVLQTIVKTSGDREATITVTFNLDTPSNDSMASRAWNNPVVLSTISSAGAKLAGVVMPYLTHPGTEKRMDAGKPLLPAWVPEKE